MNGIEFTDRYGPDGAPSVLRGCGQCEAMGCSPDMDGYQAHKYPNLDAVPFLKCVSCAGTGRVSWWATLARIPRWFVGSLRFVATGPSRYAHDRPWDWWLRFRVTFLSDLGLWR